MLMWATQRQVSYGPRDRLAILLLLGAAAFFILILAAVSLTQVSGNFVTATHRMSRGHRPAEPPEPGLHTRVSLCECQGRVRAVVAAWIVPVVVGGTGGGHVSLSPPTRLFLGAVIACAGAGFVVFNRRMSPLLLRMRDKRGGPAGNLSRTSLGRWLYERSPSGRVPALTFIGLGWVVFGVAMLATAF